MRKNQTPLAALFAVLSLGLSAASWSALLPASSIKKIALESAETLARRLHLSGTTEKKLLHAGLQSLEEATRIADHNFRPFGMESQLDGMAGILLGSTQTVDPGTRFRLKNKILSEFTRPEDFSDPAAMSKKIESALGEIRKQDEEAQKTFKKLKASGETEIATVSLRKCSADIKGAPSIITQVVTGRPAQYLNDYYSKILNPSEFNAEMNSLTRQALKISGDLPQIKKPGSPVDPALYVILRLASDPSLPKGNLEKRFAQAWADVLAKGSSSLVDSSGNLIPDLEVAHFLLETQNSEALATLSERFNELSKITPMTGESAENLRGRRVRNFWESLFKEAEGYDDLKNGPVRTLRSHNCYNSAGLL